VAQFILELYVARTDPTAVDEGAERVRAAAERLSLEGTPVVFLRSIFVPEDETCFLLFEANSIEAVRAAAERANLPFDRVSEAITEGGKESRSAEEEGAKT